MAFVVVTHREPQHGRLFTKILSGCTAMPVVEAEEGMRIEPNHVFLAPARMQATLDGERFRIAPPQSGRGWPKTISKFLLSVAEHASRGAVAVILSGKDYDGSSAMAAMRAAGGITIAQAEAACDEMPAAARKTGCVDFCLTATEIAAKLEDLAR